MKNKGFTLLELLITTGVLAVGIISIMQALSFSASAAGLVTDINKASNLAQDQLQELEFKEKLNLLKTTPPKTEGKTDRFSWEYNINFDQDLLLYKVDFDARWQRKKRTESLNLITYLKNDSP